MIERTVMVAKFIEHLCLDDSGQDLTEYALLTGALAIGSVLLFSNIGTLMQVSYTTWDTAAQNAWEPCAPGLGACP